MKTLKSLFLLCAGLSFCACSSDNEPQLPEGKAAITIKVALPTTRATVDATQTEKDDDDKDFVALSGDIIVKLTTKNADSQQTELVKVISDDAETKEVTWYGIDTPIKVEAYVNGGEYVIENDVAINSQNSSNSATISGDNNIYNMQDVAAKVPAYGSVEGNAIQETSNIEYEQGKGYKMYKADITMEIPVSRIEFSVNCNFGAEVFSSLDFQGVYLDYIKAKNTDTQVTNYRHNLDVDGDSYKTTASTDNVAAILYDYPTNAVSMVSNTSVLPEANKVYAYNVYPGSAPQIKLFFNNAKATVDESGNATSYVVPYQYAVVKSYNGNTSFEFKKGVIYKVTGLTLTEQNLATTEDGGLAGVEYGIDVTVTEATWSVESIEGSWSQGDSNN